MRILILLAAFLPLALPAAAPPKSCATPEYRQFDFWLGEWDVFNLAGKQVGRNRITLEQGECVLHEHWVDMNGGTGESFNIYDARRDVWHQTWVAATGNLLLLDGGLQGNRMVLSGEQPIKSGGSLLNRISWILQDDGSVHQVWEQSTDDGKTWKTGFHGIYRKRDQ